MLSLRCSSKLLGFKALFFAGGGPRFMLTLHPSSVTAPLHHVVSTVEQDDISLALNCGFYIVVICTSVLQCSLDIYSSNILIAWVSIKTANIFSHPWWSLAISFMCSLHSPKSFACSSLPSTITYSKVFRKENTCYSSTQNSSMCAFEQSGIMWGLSSSQQKASGRRCRFFLPNDDTTNYFLTCLGSGLH